VKAARQCRVAYNKETESRQGRHLFPNSSPENELRIVRHTGLSQKRDELILKGMFRVMFGLVFDVMFHGLQV
jgi:hypothetical protein